MGIGGRIENLRNNLGLSKRISCSEPRLNPRVVGHERIRNHGFFGHRAINILGRKNVLLNLLLREWNSRLLKLRGVQFEAVFLIGRRFVRFHGIISWVGVGSQIRERRTRFRKGTIIGNRRSR